MINSSIGLDIFAAQQYLILRGLGLGELVWKHFESTKGVNVISEIAIQQGFIIFLLHCVRNSEVCY